MLIKNFINLLKASWFQFISITVIISFLLFFLNMLLWISYSVNNFSQEVKNKLWIYFYIWMWEDDQMVDKRYEEVIELKELLEDRWFEVTFYSKSDALETLSKRMPNIINEIHHIQKYWEENPLPNTLYVIFNSKEEFELLKDLVKDYEYLISNINDIQETKSYDQQKKRAQNVIEMTNFTQYFAYFLIWVLTVIMMAFILLIIKLSFYNFYMQIEVEKLLWASYWQIKWPFFTKVLTIFWLSFMLVWTYLLIFSDYINQYFEKVFEIKFYDYLWTLSFDISKILLIEFISILFLAFIISNLFLDRLIKKV